jgi:hypothetical protein
VDENSAIVAGWYLSEDCNSIVTWGIEQKDSITWCTADELIDDPDNPNPKAGTVTSGDINPSVGYLTYMRESATSEMYK